MNVAEKVLQLKQDFDNVYAAGKAAGGGSGDYDQGYEDGKNSVVDIVPNLRSATFRSLNEFGKPRVELNFDSWTSGYLGNLFQITTEENVNTIVEELTINCNATITSLQQMLYCQYPQGVDKTLKKVTFNVLTQNCANFRNCFAGLHALVVIDGLPLDFSSNTQSSIGIFSQCYELTTFKVVQGSIYHNLNIQHSDKLSTETQQSIADGLADLTGGTAQTLTVHKTVYEQMVASGLDAIITAKNWILVSA